MSFWLWVARNVCGAGSYQRALVMGPCVAWREKPHCICGPPELISASRAKTLWTTRSHRTPMNEKAFFASGPTRAKSQPRTIARPRCRRTFHVLFGEVERGELRLNYTAREAER